MGKQVEIYTDGACSTNGTWDGGWGIVVVEDNSVVYRDGGSEKQTTNNIMEMKAMIAAIDYAIDRCRGENVIIYSDSAYIVNCIEQQWYVKWKQNGWITSKKEPVLNKELWFDIITGYTTNQKWLKIQKIKGHNGNQYNEEADKLAVLYKNLAGIETQEVST